MDDHARFVGDLTIPLRSKDTESTSLELGVRAADLSGMSQDAHIVDRMLAGVQLVGSNIFVLGAVFIVIGLIFYKFLQNIGKFFIKVGRCAGEAGFMMFVSSEALRWFIR